MSRTCITSSPKNSFSPKRLVIDRALVGFSVWRMRSMRRSMENARLWSSSVPCSCILVAVSVRRWISACSFSYRRSFSRYRRSFSMA